MGALGSLYALVGDGRALALLDQARALVGAGAPPGTESLALNYLAFTLPRRTPDERVDMLRHALTSAQREDAHEAVARAWTNLVEMLYRYGRLSEVSGAAAAGLAYARQHGYWSHAYNLEIHRALALQRRGNWAAAALEFESALARYPEPGMLLMYSLAPYARLLARRGDARAEGMLRRCWALALRTRLLSGLAFAGAGLAEWAWLAGRPDVAREVLEGWRPHAARPTADVVDAEVRRYAARAGATDDVPADGPDAWSMGLRGDWRGAIAAWERAGDPYERALELCASGEPEPALTGLRALDLLEATAAAAAVRRELAERGVRAVPRGPSRRTRINPVGLTERQLDVVRLAARGLTNAEIASRLFLSVRTVDHHVSAALAKLGVAGRRDIAAALDALGARADR